MATPFAANNFVLKGDIKKIKFTQTNFYIFQNIIVLAYKKLIIVDSYSHLRKESFQVKPNSYHAPQAPAKALEFSLMFLCN